jgi:hypothetical protein
LTELEWQKVRLLLAEGIEGWRIDELIAETVRRRNGTPRFAVASSPPRPAPATTRQAGHTAFIKIGRLVDVDLLRNVDSLADGAEVFQRGALTMLPAGSRVLVDHDDEREIGFVRELVEFPDSDGHWLAALTTITEPPGWLRRGTPASMSYLNLQRSSLGAAQRVMRGLVDEVSVLSPGVRAKEPRAKVVTFA